LSRIAPDHALMNVKERPYKGKLSPRATRIWGSPRVWLDQSASPRFRPSPRCKLKNVRRLNCRTANRFWLRAHRSNVCRSSKRCLKSVSVAARFSDAELVLANRTHHGRIRCALRRPNYVARESIISFRRRPHALNKRRILRAAIGAELSAEFSLHTSRSN